MRLPSSVGFKHQIGSHLVSGLLTSLEQLDHEHLLELLSRVAQLVPTLEQDPFPLAVLVQRIINSTNVTFNEILRIEPPIDFVAGLSVSSSPINQATLGLLQTASNNVNDVGMIAARPEIISALLKLWLLTDHTSVAEQAQRLITSFILSELPVSAGTASSDQTTMELDVSIESLGRGLMMRRLTRDKDIYRLFFKICSVQTLDDPGYTDKRRTIAQARLLDLLKKFFLLREFNTSQIRDIEDEYGVKDGGLLEFAINHMVDVKNDLLMHMTLMDLLKCLLGEQSAKLQAFIPMEQRTAQRWNEILSLLISSGVHSRTMSYYLTPEVHDPLDANFLYGKSAEYIGVYASWWPGHLLRNATDVVDRLLPRLCRSVDEVPLSQWARNNGPKHDLLLLAKLPRIVLLPRLHQQSPVFLLPTKSQSADIFSTLAKLFHGPHSTDDAAGRDRFSSAYSEDIQEQEMIGARTLYLLYFQSNRSLWKDVVATIEVTALKDNALAAISLIQAVLEANWKISHDSHGASIQDSPPYSMVMQESELRRHCRAYGLQLPLGGTQALLMSPVLEVVLPFLIKPGPFSSAGDVESSAYQIATAKQETLAVLRRKLEALKESSAQEDAGAWQEMIAAINLRADQVRPSARSMAGGMIATMER